ncbi:acyl-CoA dehydrogenase family protein, partial [Streptomyces sp. NPDC005904]|uniref:acyl-CoA dehydrogenase family protein n=1 Tax=Streptomyces sp. NPDC005904 TaxID=3154570 RepID=UPI0033CB0F04
GGEPGACGASGGVYTAGVGGAGRGVDEAGAGGEAGAEAKGKAGAEAGAEAKGKAVTEAGPQAKGKAGTETAGKTGAEATGKAGTEATGKAGGVPAKPHHGLTYLMFPLDADGVTIRPVGRLDGKPAFAELFLDDVFVPGEDVIGEPSQGWRIAMSATGNERGLTLRSPGRFLASADHLVRDWRARGDPSDTALRDRVADAVIGARAYELFTWSCASRLAAGEAVGAESSLNKVFWSEYDIALHETALDLLGPEGELTDGTDWLEGYVFSLAGPIYAGTNEIQRDIIAERLLGLPKGRR